MGTVADGTRCCAGNRPIAMGKQEVWMWMEICGYGIPVVSNSVEAKMTLSLWMWLSPRAPHLWSLPDS